MWIVNRPRQSDRTIDLILLSHKRGGVIIVADMQRKKYVMQLARELCLDIPLPITFNELRNHVLHGSRAPEVYFDDPRKELPLRLRLSVQKARCTENLDRLK